MAVLHRDTYINIILNIAEYLEEEEKVMVEGDQILQDQEKALGPDIPIDTSLVVQLVAPAAPQTTRD